MPESSQVVCRLTVMDTVVVYGVIIELLGPLPQEFHL